MRVQDRQGGAEGTEHTPSVRAPSTAPVTDATLTSDMPAPESANSTPPTPLPAEPRRIAHDFNNILTPILGYARLALDDAAPGSRLHADLTQILDAAGRARALIEEILAIIPKPAATSPDTNAGPRRMPRR